MSEYSITKSKIQGIFEPGFATHKIKSFIIVSTSRIDGVEGGKVGEPGGGGIVYLVTVSGGRVGYTPSKNININFNGLTSIFSTSNNDF